MSNINVKYTIIPEDDMRKTIKVGFGHFCLLAQYSVLTKSEKMSLIARQKADAGLAQLREFAAAPEKYLAREYTEAAWTQRKIAAGPTPKGIYNAHYWGTPPDSIVYKPMLDVPVSDGILNKYNMFCYYTRMWEYAKTSDSAKEHRRALEYANKIIGIVEMIAVSTKNLRAM